MDILSSLSVLLQCFEGDGTMEVELLWPFCTRLYAIYTEFLGVIWIKIKKLAFVTTRMYRKNKEKNKLRSMIKSWVR